MVTSSALEHPWPLCRVSCVVRNDNSMQQTSLPSSKSCAISYLAQVAAITHIPTAVACLCLYHGMGLWCRCLLIEPFPESALNEEAGKLLLENYEEYAKHAKLMTSIHAQPPKRSAHTTLFAWSHFCLNTDPLDACDRSHSGWCSSHLSSAKCSGSCGYVRQLHAWCYASYKVTHRTVFVLFFAHHECCLSIGTSACYACQLIMTEEHKRFDCCLTS